MGIRIVLFVMMLVILTAGLSWAEDEKHEFQKVEGKAAEVYPKWGATGALGYNTTGGYVETHSVIGDLKLTHDRQWTGHILKGGIAYGAIKYPDGDPITNVNNYFGNYKIEGYLHKSRIPYLWTLIGGESDEFQGFWGRYIAEGGVGANIFGVSEYVLKTELGYAFVDTNWMNLVELENGEFHLWEPTHNGIVRLIAEIPISKYVLFSEETTYRHNFLDKDDYMVESATGLNFRLTSMLSFKSTFNVTYTNKPGPIEKLDKTGATVMTDDDGDPETDEVSVLTPSDRTSMGWSNALVVTFF